MATTPQPTENLGMRKVRMSTSGWGQRDSHQQNRAVAATARSRAVTTSGLIQPWSGPSIRPKIRLDDSTTDRTTPIQSIAASRLGAEFGTVSMTNTAMDTAMGTLKRNSE